MPLERLADKSAGNLIEALERSLKRLFCTGLYTRWASASWGNTWPRSWQGIFAVLQALSAAREEELLSIREIGPRVAGVSRLSSTTSKIKMWWPRCCGTGSN